MALSLNSVTPTGHITMIIYWCAGIFNIRGLTFGHVLNIEPVILHGIEFLYSANFLGS